VWVVVIGILNNSAVMRSGFELQRSGRAIATSLERLATGKRINHAADDPSGMIAVTHLKSREAEIDGEIRGLQQQQLYFDAREGGLSPVGDMLTELNGLVVQAANGSALSSEEKDALQLQADSILQTIDRLGQNTNYRGMQILQHIDTASMGQTTYTDAAGTPHAVSLLDLKSGGLLNLRSGDMEAAQNAVKAALTGVSSERAGLGAQSQGIDSQISALQVELENTAAARGGMEDTDYASETATLMRERTKQEAATMVQQMAQSMRAETVMALLQGVKDGMRH
jgi:flagellin